MLTKGWDTISIVKQDTVNSMIEKAWNSEKAHFHIALSDESISMDGIFDCFQIISGGSDKYIKMKIPIKSGMFVLNEENINLDGISAIIFITLSMLPQPNDITILKAEYCSLVQTMGEMSEDKGGLVLPSDLEDPEGKTGAYAQLVLNIICNCLIENSEQLSMTLAEINFAGSGSPKWVLPKKIIYSYLDAGYLAILSVCSDKTIADLSVDIDVSSISLNTDSLFVISTELVLKNLILPGLAELYQNADANSYTYQNGELCNTHKLSMKRIKSGAIYYTPVVYDKGNVVKIDGSLISITYLGECGMYAGITMNWNGIVYLKLSLDNNGIISFQVDDKDFLHKENIPWYLVWLLPIAGAIVQIVVAVISDDLINSIGNKGGSIKTENIDSVTWCNRKKIIKAANISEALLLEYQLL